MRAILAIQLEILLDALFFYKSPNIDKKIHLLSLWEMLLENWISTKWIENG